MTTTEHPQGAQLTRRQLRELQLGGTGAIATEAPEPQAVVTPAAAPLPRAVESVSAPTPVVADAPYDADGDAHPLTRREARELERVRTASVPVVSEAAAVEPVLADVRLLPEPVAAEVVEPVAEEPVEAPVEAEIVADEPVEAEIVVDEPVATADIAETPVEVVEDQPRVGSSFGVEVLDPALEDTSEPEQSFDSLLGRDIDTSGSATSSHALILEDAALPPLTAPVTSNGETLLTGTFALPESLSSQGHVGAADGKDVDAVLIDGELPPASSPTPIAATAAVSQAKTPGEIIKPPAPEKSNKLMLALAITAGALAVTLGVVVVVAFLSGALTQ